MDDDGSTNNICQDVIIVGTAAYNSNGNHDGWVLEKSKDANVGAQIDPKTKTPKIGDSTIKQQYKTILSFDTSALPDDAVITGVTLNVRQAGILRNPFGTLGLLLVDVKNGVFHDSAKLQAQDFQKAATAIAVASADAAVGNLNWFSFDICGGGECALNDVINLTGKTQFRLYFENKYDGDGNEDTLRVYDGLAAAGYQPELLIEYYVP
jgi:hypothetical protein